MSPAVPVRTNSAVEGEVLSCEEQKDLYLEERVHVKEGWDGHEKDSAKNEDREVEDCVSATVQMDLRV